jgi:hypothetical protein
MAQVDCGVLSPHFEEIDISSLEDEDRVCDQASGKWIILCVNYLYYKVTSYMYRFNELSKNSVSSSEG